MKMTRGLLVVVFVLLFVVGVSSQDGIDFGDEMGVGGSVEVDGVSSLGALEDTSIGVKFEDISSYLKLGEGKEKISGQNIRISRGEGDEGTKIVFGSGGVVKIGDRTYSGLSSVKVEKNGKIETKEPQIHVSPDGKIIEAYFTASEGKYVLGNEEVSLKKGSQVAFVDNKAQVLTSSGRIEKPKLIEGEETKTDFYFSAGKNGYFTFENGDKFIGELGYENEKWFFEKDASFNHMEIKNPKGTRTYVDFNGEVNLDYDSAYISYDKSKGEIVLGNNGIDDGPGIRFLDDNIYGFKNEARDHVAFKVMGGEKSFAIIENRNAKGKSPIIAAVGHVAMNQDGGAFYLKDEKLWRRAKNIYITEFGSAKESNTVPVEFRPFKIIEGGYDYISPKDKKLVISNFNEWGYGSDADDIKGGYYYKSYSGLKKIISNKLYHNYPSIKSFTRKFGIPFTVKDSYSMGKIDTNKIRMFTDIAEGLSHTSRRWLRSDGITIQRYAGGGAAAWGWAGGLRIGANHLDPGTIRHEMTHSASLGRGGNFWSGWYAVGGVRRNTWGRLISGRAWTSNYGSTNSYEDVAEYGGEFLYKDTKSALTQGSNAKYYRAKFAYLTKWRVFTQKDFDYHMGRAGLETGVGAIDKYIGEVR